MNFTKEELENEEWLDVVGFESLYEVSNLGRVKSKWKTIVNAFGVPQKRKPKILKAAFSKKEKTPYYKVVLCNKTKRTSKTVHLIVAEAFLGHKSNKNNYIHVDHLDGNSLNNRVTNLEIVSARENVSRRNFGKTSKYTGVSRCTWNKKKFYSCIEYKQKTINLGVYESEIEAAEKYRRAKEYIEYIVSNQIEHTDIFFDLKRI